MVYLLTYILAFPLGFTWLIYDIVVISYELEGISILFYMHLGFTRHNNEITCDLYFSSFFIFVCLTSISIEGNDAQSSVWSRRTHPAGGEEGVRRGLPGDGGGDVAVLRERGERHVRPPHVPHVHRAVQHQRARRHLEPVHHAHCRV